MRNPTCQPFPKSSRGEVEMEWERQEKEKRWWRIGAHKKCMSKEFRVKVLLVKEV